jgi:exodeoxyribonuclease-3
LLKIVTWNVNSINARLETALEYLKEKSPDVVLLQETKCINDAFPTEQIADLGYNIKLHGQKTYNGVAILSKFPIEEVTTHFDGNPDENQARYIEALITVRSKVVRVAAVYVPNGQEVGSEKFEYKLKFFESIYNHLKKLLEYEEILIVGGDFNVAENDIDVFDPRKLQGNVCFHKLEKEMFRKILSLGFADSFRLLHKTSQEFSWWDYRGGSFEHNLGMRIDYLLTSPEATDLIKSSYHDHYLRALPKASDHIPVCVELSFA